MGRRVAALMLTLGVLAPRVEQALAYNAVWVESKTVLPGTTGVTVGVWVVNDTPLIGLVLPLEFRDTDGNGSYIAGSCSLAVPADHRIGLSPLMGDGAVQRVLGVPTETTCRAAVPLCCGPVGHSFNTDSAADFVSPDGFFWAGVSLTFAPALYALPAGNDSVAGVLHDWPTAGDSTLYGTGASFSFSFNVNSIEGTFEIDTMCVCPGGHLDAVPLGTESGRVSLAFQKGVVTISASPNAAPVLALIGSKRINEGDTLVFPVSAHDPNGTPPFLNAMGLPGSATLTDHGDGTGTFRFQPWFTQAGVYDVLFTASDGELADGELVPIVVTNIGDPPVLAPIGAKSVAQGQRLVFRVTATDIDGIQPDLRAENLPPNAIFVDSGNGSGLFDFQPGFTEAGVYSVGFIASDSLSADTEIVAITVSQITSVRSVETGGNVPGAFALQQNYPNPFNASTTIRFSVPHDARVRLDVFNILGRRVTTLLDGFQRLGSYSVEWDGTDERGGLLSTGVYFCRLQAGDFSKTRTMLLMK